MYSYMTHNNGRKIIIMPSEAGARKSRKTKKTGPSAGTDAATAYRLWHKFE